MSGDSAIAVLIAVGVGFVMGGTAALWLVASCSPLKAAYAEGFEDGLDAAASARRKTPKSAGEA